MNPAQTQKAPNSNDNPMKANIFNKLLFKRPVLSPKAQSGSLIHASRPELAQRTVRQFLVELVERLRSAAPTAYLTYRIAGSHGARAENHGVSPDRFRSNYYGVVYWVGSRSDDAERVSHPFRNTIKRHISNLRTQVSTYAEKLFKPGRNDRQTRRADGTSIVSRSGDIGVSQTDSRERENQKSEHTYNFLHIYKLLSINFLTIALAEPFFAALRTLAFCLGYTQQIMRTNFSIRTFVTDNLQKVYTPIKAVSTPVLNYLKYGSK